MSHFYENDRKYAYDGRKQAFLKENSIFKLQLDRI